MDRRNPTIMQGGLLGFFGKGGLKMQWARDIPYAMVTLLVYETLQKAAARRKRPGESGSGSGSPREAKANPLENMVIGAIAGGMGSLVTNPMDMIKTRMMTSPELYAGPMDAAWKALSKEGPHVRLGSVRLGSFGLAVDGSFVFASCLCRVLPVVLAFPAPTSLLQQPLPCTPLARRILLDDIELRTD